MKPVLGYEGIYSVTEEGKVYSHPRKWRSGNNRLCSHNGRWLNLREDKDGYLKVMLCKDGKMKHIGTHRLVAQAYLPAIEGKTVVNHKDADKGNNHFSNLEWCTASENKNHAQLNNLLFKPKGVLHNMSKLTDEDILDIRMFATKGLSHGAIAKVYPVVRQTISRICSRELWGHV